MPRSLRNFKPSGRNREQSVRVGGHEGRQCKRRPFNPLLPHASPVFLLTSRICLEKSRIRRGSMGFDRLTAYLRKKFTLCTKEYTAG